MGRVRVQTDEGDDLLLPLFALCVLGRGHGLSWTLAPPLLKADQPTVPNTWITFRWRTDDGRWGYEASGATTHLNADGGALQPGHPLRVGDQLRGPRATVTVVDLAPPEPLAVRLRDNGILVGEDLVGLVEHTAGGWHTDDGHGPLREGEVFVARGIPYRMHIAAPVIATKAEGIDLGATDWRGEIQIFDRPRPSTLRITAQRAPAVQIEGDPVIMLAVYTRARETHKPADGWLGSTVAKMRYKAFGGGWTVDASTLRSKLTTALANEGVHRAHMLFETRGAGPATELRLGVAPGRLTVIDLRASKGS